VTKPWSSWSRIDRNHPRIRPRGSKWRRNQQEAAAGELRWLGTELDRAAEGITRRLRRPARAAGSTPGGGSSKPRWEPIESRGGGRPNWARNSSPAPNSSTNPDLGSSNRKLIEGGRAGGIRGWDLRRGSGESFLIGGFLAPQLFENRRACVRLHAISRARTDERTETPKATPRGEPKGGRRRREEREGSRRASTQREFLCAREGMEEMEREGRDASDGRAGWCRRKCAVDPSTSERLRPPPTRRVEREQLPAGPGGMGPPVGDGAWLVAERDVACGRGGGGARVSVPGGRTGGPEGGGAGEGGEGRGGHYRLRRTGGGSVAGGARGHSPQVGWGWVVVSLSALRAVRSAGRPGGRRRFGFPGGTQEDHELRWPPGSELTPNIESTSEQVL